METNKFWTFDSMPAPAKENIMKSYTATNVKKVRESLNTREGLSDGLFSDVEVAKHPVKYRERKVIWATDNYSEMKVGYRFNDYISDLSIIKPRVEKDLEAQKKRSKTNAEVFTPVWICNLQNNLMDDELLGKNSFNIPTEDQKSWVSSKKVKFNKDYTWTDYVASRRLEMCCGEGPYLFSVYDATTGENISVRDENGSWMRIGLLDRKLRVIAENVDTIEDWKLGADVALRSTYGYEYQGDNLVLARLNMINTYFDYLREFCVDNNLVFPDPRELVEHVSEVVSWQIWQMDGLKMTVPETCKKDCKSCVIKSNTNHNGIIPVIRWGEEIRIFDEFLI